MGLLWRLLGRSMDGASGPLEQTNSIRPADQDVGQNKLLRLWTQTMLLEALVSICTAPDPSSHPQTPPAQSSAEVSVPPPAASWLRCSSRHVVSKHGSRIVLDSCIAAQEQKVLYILRTGY